MLKRVLLASLACMFALGCSGDQEAVDPYAEASLRTLLYGPSVISKGMKYKIRNPQIIAVANNTAMIRSGNITSMLVGPSIGSHLEGAGGDMVFNVAKKFSPYVHFRVEQIVANGDTTIVNNRPVQAPIAIPVADYRSRDHEEWDLDRLRWNNTEAIKKAIDKQFTVEGTITMSEEDGEEIYLLQGTQSTYRIDWEGVPSDGVEMVLETLIKNGGAFKGGITLTEEEAWPDRRNNQIIGTVVVDYVEFMGRVFAS